VAAVASALVFALTDALAVAATASAAVVAEVVAAVVAQEVISVPCVNLGLLASPDKGVKSVFASGLDKGTLAAVTRP
jgi:hypothetical protein